MYEPSPDLTLNPATLQEDRAKKQAKPDAGAKGTAATFLSALPPPKHYSGGGGGDGDGGAAPLGGGLLGAGAGAGGTGLVRSFIAHPAPTRRYVLPQYDLSTEAAG